MLINDYLNFSIFLNVQHFKNFLDGIKILSLKKAFIYRAEIINIHECCGDLFPLITICDLFPLSTRTIDIFSLTTIASYLFTLIIR